MPVHLHCRRSTKRHAAPGSTAAANSDLEGYTHGTLSTAGISGASPALHSITRARAKAMDGKPASSTPAGAGDSQVSLVTVMGCSHCLYRHTYSTGVLLYLVGC